MRCKEKSEGLLRERFSSQIKKQRLERTKVFAPYFQSLREIEMSGAATSYIVLTEKTVRTKSQYNKDPRGERQKEPGTLRTSLSCYISNGLFSILSGIFKLLSGL